MYELQNIELPTIEKHEGPPVGSGEREENFIEKYFNNEYGGPFIEGKTWKVFRRRKFTNIKNLLENKLAEARHGAHILKKVKEGKFNIYVDNEAFLVYNTLPEDFLIEVRKWLEMSPRWLLALRNSQNQIK